MSMHADEESDEGVVPMKRSNNESVSSAETGEGRTSPKGNGGQTAALEKSGSRLDHGAGPTAFLAFCSTRSIRNDGGEALDVRIHVEDPGAFTMPWKSKNI
jgi:hypothetical protein